MKKFLYLLIAGLVVLPAFSADEDESSLAVEEVIVTAERREASIMDTAISITAFDESLIETLNLRNQEDLSSRAMEVATDLATLGHPHYQITKELDQKDTLDKVLSAISGNS